MNAVAKHNIFTTGKHERKACDVPSITESNTIKYSQWCTHRLRDADLYTSCTVLIGGYCILMPILVAIILQCLTAGNQHSAELAAPGDLALIGSSTRGLFSGCWQQAALRALSVRNTRRESVPITNLSRQLTHNDLQIDPYTNMKIEICNFLHVAMIRGLQPHCSVVVERYVEACLLFESAIQNFGKCNR